MPEIGPRIADRLPVEQLRAAGDRTLDRVGVGEVGEGHIDTHPSQRHVELGVRASVERPRSDDLVPLPAQGEHGDELGCLTGRGGERPDPLLERCGRRVADPGVDVAVRLEREQVGGVLSIVEHERGGRIDRLCTRSGLGIRSLAGVDRSRVEPVLVVAHG